MQVDELYETEALGGIAGSDKLSLPNMAEAKTAIVW